MAQPSHASDVAVGLGSHLADPTSWMIVESALCLAEDSEQIPVGGGSWTPASAFGELLLDRVTSHAGGTVELEPGFPREAGEAWR